jgi:hypothetical protein
LNSERKANRFDSMAFTNDESEKSLRISSIIYLSFGLWLANVFVEALGDCDVNTVPTTPSPTHATSMALAGWPIR